MYSTCCHSLPSALPLRCLPEFIGSLLVCLSFCFCICFLLPLFPQLSLPSWPVYFLCAVIPLYHICSSLIIASFLCVTCLAFLRSSSVSFCFYCSSLYLSLFDYCFVSVCHLYFFLSFFIGTFFVFIPLRYIWFSLTIVSFLRVACRSVSPSSSVCFSAFVPLPAFVLFLFHAFYRCLFHSVRLFLALPKSSHPVACPLCLRLCLFLIVFLLLACLSFSSSISLFLFVRALIAVPHLSSLVACPLLLSSSHSVCVGLSFHSPYWCLLRFVLSRFFLFSSPARYFFSFVSFVTVSIISLWPSSS